MTQLTMADLKAGRLPIQIFASVLTLLGIATTAWLVADFVTLDHTGVLTVVARVGGAVFWFAAAACAFSDRAVRGGGLQVLVGAFLVGAVALVVGLLVTPSAFAGITAVGPDTASGARTLGIVTVVLVALGWVWSRFFSARARS